MPRRSSAVRSGEQGADAVGCWTRPGRGGRSKQAFHCFNIEFSRRPAGLSFNSDGAWECSHE
jgi:hypothetical protein